MKYTLIVLLLFLLCSCAPYPHVGYYEMDEAIRTAETPKEKAYYEKKLESFEQTVIAADEFIMNREACYRMTACHMECVWYSIAKDPDRINFKDLNYKARWYRSVRTACFFIVDDWR